jgi:hypothetical protein
MIIFFADLKKIYLLKNKEPRMDLFDPQLYLELADQSAAR